MSTTFDWLSTTLEKEYSLDPALLTPAASLESLGLDSLAVAELLFNVEDRFHINLGAESASLATLGDVARIIDEHVEHQTVDGVQAGATHSSSPSSP
ncbi:Acyl carrier protein [Burkholderia sp. 8Y]|uniref:acyl carrier protein n=1 Tax=Burkholderia sp. 8Y TaxID=2653133 RepID=UPI0012F39174|nr:phosphopantetheine-binding protein [Burkholderia sp. 8Y]VXC67336.1 Acyl carrier protein [Burkholderia sp. 8Y]